MNTYRLLDWDSDFFGFMVARILSDKLKLQELKETLACMKLGKITLAYWNSAPEDRESREAARSCNGFLADKKVTFVIDAEDILKRSVPGIPKITVEEYIDVCPTPELEALAIQAGNFSRFKVDPCIPDSQFQDLYKLWIRESVNKNIAWAVLVVRNRDKIVGMVTIGKNDGRAAIGLLSVDYSMQGRNLGLSLVQAAQKLVLKKGFDALQVVTQEDNIPACRFYENCGYRIDRIQHIYHFWM